MTLRAIAILSLVLLVSSCRHHDLCFHHAHEITIRVEYDWRYCPEATVEGMGIYFYREGDNHAVYYAFEGMHGGNVSLTTGRYRIITYNNDTEATKFDRHHSFNDHMAYTRQGNVLEPILDEVSPAALNGETVVICPDEIYGCSAVEVEITQDGISYICVPLDEADDYIGLPITTQEQLITLFPQDILCHYSYEVLHVNGVERIQQLCGSISGMCPSVLMADGTKHELPVTLPYSSCISYDGRITGEFLTFGHHNDVKSPHRMEFYVWTHDGRKLILGRGADNFDVTNQVHTASNPRRVHLVIDHLDIPVNETPVSGQAAPSTDDWFEVVKEINM